MKISKLSVKNFRSLKDITIDELGNLVILIGKNGSGKSNILELLEMFFVDLHLYAATNKGYPVENWYHKRASRNIIVDLKLLIKKEELESTNLSNEDIFNKEKDTDVKLSIHRELSQTGWLPPEINLNGYSFNYEANALTYEDKPLQTQKSHDILNKTVNLVKQKFNLIRGPRESPQRSSPTTRTSIIDPDSKQNLIQLANTTTYEKEAQWTSYEDKFTRFSGKELRLRSNNLVFRNGNYTLPVEYSGSGDQAMLILMRHINEPNTIYCIEEPETRLHHDYQRKTYNWLKQTSQESQIIVATHSCVFVDKDNLENTWMVTAENGESEISRIKNDDLKYLLLDLGIKPSDFFFSDVILFVEGKTESSVLPLIAHKAGINISNISIIPIHGKGKGKYHFSVWADAAKNTNVPYYFILDNDAEKEIKVLEKEGLIDRDNYLLLDGEFEDLYPAKLVEDILRTMVEETDLESVKISGKKPKVEQVSSILKRSNWKVELGMKVADKITKNQIKSNMDNLIRLLGRIQD